MGKAGQMSEAEVRAYGAGVKVGRLAGKRDGLRHAITWLREQAKRTRDPKAKAILVSTADSLAEERRALLKAAGNGPA